MYRKQILSKISAVGVILATIFFGNFLSADKVLAACPAGQLAKIKFLSEDHNGNTAKKIKWELYEQRKDTDGNKLLYSKMAASDTGEIGSSEISFDPQSKPDANAFALKIYDSSADAGYFVIWDISVACGSSINRTLRMSGIKVILRNSEGISLKNQIFEIYEQNKNVEGQPIVGKIILKSLNTGVEGSKFVYLPKGEYIIKVPAIDGVSYTKNNVTVNESSQTVIDYTLSNITLQIRDGENKLQFNVPFTVYKQAYDSEGNPILGELVKKGNTGKTGVSDILLPAGTYAFQFIGSGNTNIYLWNKEIDENENHSINFVLNTLKISVRGLNEKLLSDVAVTVYKQEIDADGKPIVGAKVISGSTGKEGIVNFFLSEGKYAIETIGPDKQKLIFFDNNVERNSLSSVTKTLSAVKFIVKDSVNGNLLENVEVSILEQDKDAAGNFVPGKVLMNKNTKNFGSVEFYFPPGAYAFRVKGTTKKYYYFYDNRIEKDRAKELELVLSVLRITAQNENKQFAGGIKSIVLEQNYDLANDPIKGEMLYTITTNNKGFYDVLLPQGIYVLTVGEKNNFNVKIEDGYYTNVSLKTKDGVVLVDMISAPRPAASRPDNSLLKSNTTGKIYVFANQQLRYIGSPAIFAKNGYKWSDVITVTQSELDGYEIGLPLGLITGVIKEGSLVKEDSSPAVYLIEKEKRRPFVSGQVFEAKGYKWNDILIVSKEALDKYQSGAEIVLLSPDSMAGEGSLIKSEYSPIVYYIVNNKKAPIANERIFIARGFRWFSIITISQSKVDSFEEMSPIDFAADDNDRDGLTDTEELSIGTLPNDDDTDNDGFLDGQELRTGFNPKGEGRRKS